MTARRPWTTHEEHQLRTEYGKTDIHRLALKMNRTVNSLHCRAEKLGITFDRRAQLGPEFSQYIQQKKLEGWSDQQIADEWGANVGTVGQWRRRLSIPTNHMGEQHRAKLRAAYKRHVRDNGVKCLADLRYLRRRVEAAKMGKVKEVA